MFSPGTERAVLVALAAHAYQVRKGEPDVPYAVHPIHVALMLARLGASDETVQAGLLHDVLEDVPGWDGPRIEAEFGERVRALVEEVSEDKSRSWSERKQAAVERAADLSPEAALIQACDKLHNLSTLTVLLAGSGVDPAVVWERFRGGREASLRVWRDLVEALAPRLPDPLWGALRAALASLEALEGR